uniref:Intracellular lectin protein 2 n=2 Tax=Wuchereria bancrofti TaxID=6293 RepID=A0A1I8EHN6_WUCBA
MCFSKLFYFSMLNYIVICVVVVMLMHYNLLDMRMHVRECDVSEREILEKQNCAAICVFTSYNMLLTHHLFIPFLTYYLSLQIRNTYGQQQQQQQQRLQLSDTSVDEWRGYFRKEHSLAKPYQGNGMGIPYWDIQGTTIVTGQYVRLTADTQSVQGGIWNNVPVNVRDWELHVNFAIHGSTGDLFGDGAAIWYVQDPAQAGPVFGSKDYFRGLGIFLDTYSNHNGPHGHGHPYISAMINNGSLHYDHDMDGTHTQLGGEHTGCEAKFRNKQHQTQIMIRYVGDVLSIYTDVLGTGQWKECMSVDGVQLPTGYHFGITAATGDLSDYHDIISVRMFEQEFAHVQHGTGVTVDPRQREPYAQNVAAPRDHIDQPPASKLGWFGTTVLVILGGALCVLVLWFGVIFVNHRQQMSRKRFY